MYIRHTLYCLFREVLIAGLVCRRAPEHRIIASLRIWHREKEVLDWHEDRWFGPRWGGSLDGAAESAGVLTGWGRAEGRSSGWTGLSADKAAWWFERFRHGGETDPSESLLRELWTSNGVPNNHVPENESLWIVRMLHPFWSSSESQISSLGSFCLLSVVVHDPHWAWLAMWLA